MMEEFEIWWSNFKDKSIFYKPTIQKIWCEAYVKGKES